MKILSFSAVEILPALLKWASGEENGKKQTIRPAWKELSGKKSIAEGRLKLRKLLVRGYIEVEREESPHGIWHYVVEMPARFKVGEKVQICWKSRRTPKNSWFCSNCGGQVKDATNKENGFPYYLTKHCGISCAFPKVLGTATITDVFQIEWDNAFNAFILKRTDGRGINSVTQLAQFDGFRSFSETQDWFDSHYDLSSPKKFWVYRWGEKQ